MTRRALAALALCLCAASALANKWPERPIKIVVPYPPGGLTDVVTRTLGDELGAVLGTQVVVENKPGAGGQVGLQGVLAAPRDGYTVALVVPATMITLPLTNPAYKIRPLQDFEPITAAVQTSLILAVNKDLGVRTLAEFTAYARRNTGKLNYGTPGAGTSFHFNNVLMANKMGFQGTHVPYHGEARIFLDLISGQIQYALLSTTMRAQVMDGGKVVALAVSGNRREESMPQVPTFKEQGVDFVSDGWVGYAVASGTPPSVIARLGEAFTKALRTPSVAQRLDKLGLDVWASTPAQFRSAIQEGDERYGALVRSGAIKID
ncbi:MAG: tripartite tricarboxylate transporter substrate binding protein [Burkholderiales bacterium]|nr:tripartite tricarboxylate transporter substrate binding protein [Burkholderiales bacterium]